MKKINKEEEKVPVESEMKEQTKAPISSLSVMEGYAILGLELGQKIYEKVVEVEKSVEIIAAHMKREANPD